MKLFLICSYIQKRTPNPINSFKVTTCDKKDTNYTTPNIYQQYNRAFQTFQVFENNVYSTSNFHTSNLIYFEYFIYLLCSANIHIGMFGTRSKYCRLWAGRRKTKKDKQIPVARELLDVAPALGTLCEELRDVYFSHTGINRYFLEKHWNKHLVAPFRPLLVLS